MKRWIAALFVLFAITLAARARAEDAPRTVWVGTYVNAIYGIDIKGSQFTIDFYAWWRWEGDDLKPYESFEIAGGKITSKAPAGKRKIGNVNYYSLRVIANVTKFWDLRRYPLDHHTFVLEIEDAEHDTRTVHYEADKENVGYSPDLQVAGWALKSTHADIERHVYHTNYGDTSLATNNESSYDRYRYSIDVVRPGYGRFLKVFFGLFISVLVSWCAFWVRPKESSPRVSLGIGATFAAAAVTVTINNSLPDTNAVTMADKLIMLTLGMIVASVAVTIVALALFAKDREAQQQKLDRICRIVFPLVYLATLIAIVT